MPRERKRLEKLTEIDPRYGNILVGKFINKIMKDGKKSVAQHLMYKTLDNIAEELKKDPVEVFEQAIKNVSPLLQVKSRRIGGATYQIPLEVKGDRKTHYAFIWIRDAARSRKGKSFDKRLAEELIDAYNNVGASIKKKEDTHKMAEANKAFAHFARY
ncbi:MAG: 30S ribosomal protein S7 [Bacteriovoracaceae bacterium]